MKKLVCCCGLVILLNNTAICIGQEPVSAQDLKPFTLGDVQFDPALSKKAPPAIPREWKFIGVSSGESPSASNLWFQDLDGNIYLVQGLTSNGKFMLKDQVQRLKAGPAR